MSELLDQFIEEGSELLNDAVSGLLEVERRPDDAELLNVVFRAAHTFKGASGLFEFAPLTQVVHAAEDVLDAVRQGRLTPDAAVVDATMSAFDLAQSWLATIAQSGKLPDDAELVGPRAAVTLRNLLGDEGVVSAAANSAPRGPQPLPEWAAGALRDLGERVALDVLDGADSVVALRYTPSPDVFFRGDDPLALVRELGGTVLLDVSRDGPWPVIAELDQYDCAVCLTVIAAVSPQTAEEQLRYVRDEVELVEVTAADVRAASLGSALSDAVRGVLAAQRRLLAAPCPEEERAQRLRSVANTIHAALNSTGRAAQLLDAAELDALARADAPALERVLALLLGDQPSVSDPAEQIESPVNAPRAPVSRTVKVDQAKLDHLLELVGELVVAKNALPFIARAAEDGADNRTLARSIKESHQATNRIAEELQAMAMGMRMLPVGVVFGRFPRLVRDLARRLDKQVSLVTEGEDTAADKDVLELLADPLVHLVRNCLDHGLETSIERIAAGKPAQGRLTLRASQEADSVRVDVCDDGRGIDPDAIRRVARARGLEVDGLSDQAARELIFAPGFSTAEEISDLSGRGVGMDAVRAVIERLGGSIGLDSEFGAGTTVSLKLPLSMAVTRVMVVVVAGQRFGIPVEHIRETLRVSPSDIRGIGHQPAIELRGHVVPLFDLGEELGLDPAEPEEDAVRILVVNVGGEEVGLIVERFEDHFDMICKPPDGVLAGNPALSGTALLGDGQVLLVLNIREVLGNAVAVA